MDSSPTLTMLRTAATYRMATTITDEIVNAARWQQKQAEALQVAIACIEERDAEIAALKDEVARLTRHGE